MRDERLLLRICTLSRGDREWIFSSLPDDVRQNLLFKLTHLIQSDTSHNSSASEEFLHYVEIVRWIKFLSDLQNDRVSMGGAVPDKLFGFIRDKYCK